MKNKDQHIIKIFIENMVSLRCKMVVKAELDRLDIIYISIELGEVVLPKKITQATRNLLSTALHVWGLELMDDKTAVLIEKIKNIVVEMVHYAEDLPEVKFSIFLSEKLNQDYHKLSEVFSKTKGTTIEHYIILHKIERIKELIIYDELNLSEISQKMHYSSVAHLSNQFKKVTGLTPSFFKKLVDRKRQTLESI